MLRLCPCQNKASSKNCNHLRIRIRYVLNIFFFLQWRDHYSDPIIGGLAELITNPDSFPYEEIPGFPQSTVEGEIFFSEICLKYPDKTLYIFEKTLKKCFEKLSKKYFDARTRWSSSSWTTQQHSSPHYAGEVSFLWRYKP